MDVTATEGSSVVIECAGQGYPQPLEAWEKLHAQEFPPGIEVKTTGALVIGSVSASHGGIYICSLRDRNRAELARKEIRLTVSGRLDCSNLLHYVHARIS